MPNAAAHVHTPPDLISAAQAATMAGVNRATVTRWAASGKLPTAFKADGDTGIRFFHRADVERLAAKRAPAEAAS